MKLPPELAARYTVLRELGRGASGVVSLVAPVGGGDELALKMVAVTGDGAREARELALAQRVRHPHLMETLEAGLVGATAYLIMPVAEASLEGSMKQPEPRREAWRLLREAAAGVAALHRQGMTHRDLKPANVLVVNGLAKVADYGMARAEDSKTLTAMGMILGTPAYMAPEQAQGKRATPASDIYALGVMAFEVLEGVVPYAPGLPLPELLARVARGQRDAFHRARETVSPRVLAAVNAALEPAPENRPRDLDAWIDELLLDPWVSPPAGATISGSASPPEAAVTVRNVVPPEAKAKTIASPPTPRSWTTWVMRVVGLVLILAIGGLFSAPGVPDPVSLPLTSSEIPPPDSDRVIELGKLDEKLQAKIDVLAAPFLLEPGGEFELRKIRFRDWSEKRGQAFRNSFGDLLLEEGVRQSWIEYLDDLRRWLRLRRDLGTLADEEGSARLFRFAGRFLDVYLAALNGIEHAEDIYDPTRTYAVRKRVTWLQGELKTFEGELSDLFGPRPWTPLMHRIRLLNRRRCRLSPKVEDIESLIGEMKEPPGPEEFHNAARTLIQLLLHLEDDPTGIPCPARARVLESVVDAVTKQTTGLAQRLNAVDLLTILGRSSACASQVNVSKNETQSLLGSTSRLAADVVQGVEVPIAVSISASIYSASRAWRGRDVGVECQLRMVEADVATATPNTWEFLELGPLPARPSEPCGS